MGQGTGVCNKAVAGEQKGLRVKRATSLVAEGS